MQIAAWSLSEPTSPQDFQIHVPMFASLFFHNSVWLFSYKPDFCTLKIPKKGINDLKITFKGRALIQKLVLSYSGTA